MPADFPSVIWNEDVAGAAVKLIELAHAEDLSGGLDWTTVATVDHARRGVATFVAREPGIVCGIEIGPLVLTEFGADAEWRALAADGDAVTAGQPLATVEGRAADLLTCERTVLNFMGRLSGIATLTHKFVEQVEGTGAELFDTRKTTPGWRLLEKYAVRCGGGRNHRLGLSEAVLIKDNHLALSDRVGLTPAGAVSRARQAIAERLPDRAEMMVIEVEVDTLDQLRDALPAKPDIVLLDNMTTAQLQEAVTLRDATAPGVVLEASGGVTLSTIGVIAQSGVDRISVGALTHSAVGLDIGLDWGM